MTRVILLSFLFLSGLQLSAQMQEYCGTRGLHEEWEAFKREFGGEFVNSRTCEYRLPITVHVLGDNNGIGYLQLGTLFGSLEALNKDFAETGISFFLSGPINYVNNSSWYSHQGFATGTQMMLANNVANTINCYIVENAAGNCGYRSFNGDAIVIAKACSSAQDHTWAHEMGHWLSLSHTFLGWEEVTYDNATETPDQVGFRQVELVDGTNCTSASDRICDTKSDYLSFRWACNDNAEYPDSLTDPSGAKFAVDGSLFMSYANDNCQSRFSDGQTDEMCDYVQNFVPEIISNEPALDPVDISQTELIYPINDELVQGAVQLQWEENGSATYYIVEVSRFPNMGILSFRELVNGTSIDVFGLTEGKSYYWRVRGMNEYDFNYDNKSGVEKFQTGELSSTNDYYAENLRIYPNPVGQGGSLFIDLDSQAGERVNLRITALDGQTFYSQEHFIKHGSNSLEINSSNLPAGIYFLTGIGEKHKFQKKVVIE